MIRRRCFIVGGAALALGPAGARAGQPLTLLLPGAAGSPSDRTARAFAPFLERHLPHSAVWVSNRPGEAGLVGLSALAAAEPTGHTMGWVSTPALTARSVDHAGAHGLLGALRLVGAVAKEPIAFVSSRDSPLASTQELVQRSAEDAAAMPLGTPPVGSPPHLAALRLQAIARTSLNIVAFPSAAAAGQAALAGNVAAAALGLGDALEGLRAGRLSGLGIAATRRPDAFPDIAPMSESGLMLSALIHRGIAVPAATPDDICAQLAAALRDVVADPEFGAQAASDGFIATWDDGETWTARANEERAELSRLWGEAPWLASGVG